MTLFYASNNFIDQKFQINKSMSRHLKQNSATKSTSDENHLYDIQMSFKHAFGVSSPLDDKTILLTQTQDESGQISDFTIFPVGKHGTSKTILYYWTKT